MIHWPSVKRAKKTNNDRLKTLSKKMNTNPTKKWWWIHVLRKAAVPAPLAVVWLLDDKIIICYGQ